MLIVLIIIVLIIVLVNYNSGDDAAPQADSPDEARAQDIAVAPMYKSAANFTADPETTHNHAADGKTIDIPLINEDPIVSELGATSPDNGSMHTTNLTQLIAHVATPVQFQPATTESTINVLPSTAGELKNSGQIREVVTRIPNDEPARPPEHHPDIHDEKIQIDEEKHKQYRATGSVLSGLRNITTVPVDNTIIDVASSYGAVNLPPNASAPDLSVTAVYWPHFYIYSYDDLSSASSQQQAFYRVFKDNFLKGVFLQLNGNTNYAFILLFDLVNNYEQHRNVLLTQKQLTTLGHYYPQTESYIGSVFLKKLNALGDYSAIDKLDSQQNTWYPLYKAQIYQALGDRFKTKLQLSPQQVDIVNKVSDHTNSFCEMEGCLIAVIKLYLRVIEKMTQHYREKGLKFDTIVEGIAELAAPYHYSYYAGLSNLKYMLQAVKSDLYVHLFRRCENAVREIYAHKRRISEDTFFNSTNCQQKFDAEIVQPFRAVLPDCLALVEKPDTKTQVELNTQTTSRWKAEFELLCKNFKADHLVDFRNGIISLGELNIKNPVVENIFLEASKFVAKYDKTTSLELYLHYIYHDLKSATFDNKKLTKTIQKSLFTNPSQLDEFEAIINKLVSEKKLDDAVSALPTVYLQKRKKIQLDVTAIKQAEKLHSGTVELLNQYLDEGESETEQDEVQLQIADTPAIAHRQEFKNGIVFTTLQLDLISLFQKSNFNVEKELVEDFAKTNKVFPSQLVESINENCFEILDDVLIEDDDDYYTVNPDYFQNIIAI